MVAVDSGEHLKYTLGDAHPAFGSPLTVHLPTNLSAERLLRVKLMGVCVRVILYYSKLKIAVQYESKEPGQETAVSALDWLEPAQTVGKVHPYLFTQCQVWQGWYF